MSEDVTPYNAMNPQQFELRSYREQANMSQGDLGKLLGVTRQTIAAWENGERAPSLEQLSKIARALNTPLELLLGEAKESGPSLLFRSDNPESLSPELRALLARKYRDYASVESMTGEPSALPPSRNLEGYDPLLSETMGQEIRDWLGVEQAPLGDVLSILEEKGIKVILHPLPNEVSGLSAYTDELGGVIFVNAGHPTERQYFTALHELGHLIFHRREYGKPQSGKDREKENMASHFSGAVLMPRTVVEKELRNYRKQWIPEPLLQDLKLRYQISMRTILIRANQVGLMPLSLKRQQYDALDKKYGPTKEDPVLPLPQTLRRLERLVYQALLKEEITTSRAAEILNKPLVEVHRELSNWLEEGD
ncbi:DNA-binding protein [Desulfuromonas sp. DDH964]|uniref:XRE family transcriptional regulator n=1 Tax=Desulfuromonas sp. DDH964 TaxID=1823759 RepID=UPI00078CFB5A|nr:XRE family transcriptional regulator [Desulfuromonas sp. DDH964]AMV70698.1 DNA-binding protein [Desulfuromonas sp. DDH964]